MIHFIDLTDQITIIPGEKCKEFAFFDTVTESFCTFHNVQTWETKEEFLSDCKDILSQSEINRFLSLIPYDF